MKHARAQKEKEAKKRTFIHKRRLRERNNVGHQEVIKEREGIELGCIEGKKLRRAENQEHVGRRKE